MSATSSDHPYLLLFDGVCNLCDGAVQFVLKHDPQGRIHFGSIQSEAGSQLYRQHGLDPEKPHTMLFISPKGVFHQSDAALEIAGQLGLPWSLAKVFKVIPKPLRDRAYRFIADHRYQWFGKHDQCALPRPEWRGRFLKE